MYYALYATLLSPHGHHYADEHFIMLGPDEVRARAYVDAFTEVYQGRLSKVRFLTVEKEELIRGDRPGDPRPGAEAEALAVRFNELVAACEKRRRAQGAG